MSSAFEHQDPPRASDRHADANFVYGAGGVLLTTKKKIKKKCGPSSDACGIRSIRTSSGRAPRPQHHTAARFRLCLIERKGHLPREERASTKSTSSDSRAGSHCQRAKPSRTNKSNNVRASVPAAFCAIRAQRSGSTRGRRRLAPKVHGGVIGRRADIGMYPSSGRR